MPRGRYTDTERVYIMTSITTSLLYHKIIYHKQFLTEKIQLLVGKKLTEKKTEYTVRNSMIYVRSSDVTS